jgi:hypothetical protein
LYFASIAPGTGELAALTMVPMRARNMQLRRASAADSRWLAATLGHISRQAGSRVEYRSDGRLIVHPQLPSSLSKRPHLAACRRGRPHGQWSRHAGAFAPGAALSRKGCYEARRW